MMKNDKLITIKLTPKETSELSRYFYLPGWQFESLIKSNCTEISSTILGWQNNIIHRATIYGLMAIKTETKENCIANFFVHYGSQVYQLSTVEDAIKTIKLLQKKFTMEKLESKLRLERNKIKK